MKLHDLRDNSGATKKAKRVGRGPGSGKGKTAGRQTLSLGIRNWAHLRLTLSTSVTSW